MRKDRLRKLGQALIEEKHGFDTFNYRVYAEKTKCGTQGCALGACAVVFPGEWENIANCKIDDWIDLTPTLRESGLSRGAAAEDFFEIDPRDYCFLFEPSESPCSYDATSKEVGEHILKFVENGGIY